jgi:hypothetical protein
MLKIIKKNIQNITDKYNMIEKDKEIIELASIGCSPAEIIAELDLEYTEEEFNKLYDSVMKKGKLKYQVSLKRAIASQAKEDPSILKWASSQHIDGNLKENNKYSNYTREQLLEILNGKN